MPRDAWWISATDPDTHAAFRGRFPVAQQTEIEFRIAASCPFTAVLDGAPLLEGPCRYHPSAPEYQMVRRTLSPGMHVLALHAHHLGVHTRLMRALPPAVGVEIVGMDTTVTWRARRLDGYRSQAMRINPQLGWIDWWSGPGVPEGWMAPGFDDGDWPEPLPSALPPAAFVVADVALVPSPAREATCIAQGVCAETFGYELDDPAMRFLLRDLAPARLPVDGCWWRFDLGRVRLGRPALTIACPAGTVVEWALSERLDQGRVAPVIPLSAGRSCTVDHMVAVGGVQDFMPSGPRGGRFLEVHVLAPPSTVRLEAARWRDRAGLGEPVGRFACPDETLTALWAMGVETLRACAEDAIVDTPVRERGQWTGDAVIALETLAVAYGDVRLAERALRQAAVDAREDGLVSGLSPADSLGMSTYAMQWTEACVRSWELTGGRRLLDDLAPAAARSAAALAACAAEEGLHDRAGWGFIDWGYDRPPGPTDLAVDLRWIASLRAHARWRALRDERRSDDEAALEARVTAAVRRRIADLERAGGRGAGYHVLVLAALLQLLEPASAAQVHRRVAAHWRSSFPLAPDAPRLAGPHVRSTQLVTPYFAHWGLAALAEAGGVAEMLALIRAAWGWMRAEGATTCWEVFDSRWSHCHQWSACPTWQLTRYVLGLEHAGHLGPHHVRLRRPAGVTAAEGRLPLFGGGWIDARWRVDGDAIRYEVSATAPAVLVLDDRRVPIGERPTSITL